ncbi:cation-dependent mannose-6-phosphate receptor-like [Orbicella faveolata]|uniref:cation-dependent mannose-6-phosphate receptor-like n=1 Tax=Orbicella faveolata TaxID=48498 RepID=UPI0009E2B9B8|nr:cation-dependent mannose-6-phosphate receptor-like [Orbicella faveolata]
MLLGNHIKFVTIFVNTIDEIHAIFFKLGIGAVPKIWHSALNIALRKPGNQQPLPCVTFCLFDMGRTNFNTWRAFLVVWILFAFKFFDTHAEICEKIDECSCRKSNGKVISLRQIDGGTTPAFINVKDATPSQTMIDYAWNPCTKFNLGTGCENALMCQEDTATHERYTCASTVANFNVDKDGTTYIIYQSVLFGTKGYERRLQIGLKCNESKFPGEVTSVLEDLVASVSDFSTTFTSKCACDDGCPLDSGGLSAGSILLIVFFVLLIVYVIGGILINKYKFGVQSMPEMCPNYQFWAGVPSLIKDGIVFTCGSIKSGCSSLCQKCNKNNKYENIP